MKLHILFVDDDPRMLRVLRSALRSAELDWEIVFAQSGREALELLDRAPFQIVVSDLQMPIMNGLEFLAEVRRRLPTARRLILSGSAEAEQLQDQDPVAERILGKPLDISELIEVVLSMAGKPG